MYISNLLQDSYKTWADHSEVIIDAPTGSGKTSFILKNLLPYALKNNLEILYICNREILYKQLASELCEYYEIPYELLDNYNFCEFPGITLTTYQTLQAIVRGKLFNQIPFYYYVVADEIHYIAADAEFNSEIDLFWKWWNQSCSCNVKIMISATLDDVYPYIASFSWQEYNFWPPLDNKYESKYERIFFREPTHVMMRLDRKVELLYHYKIPRDNWTHPIYVFDDESDIIHAINDFAFDGKWLIFQSNKKKAQAMKKELIPSCDFLSAETKDSDVMKEIIDNQTFSKQILITTKVLDNGVSLHDKNIKNIVLNTISKTDFLQMLGRRRKCTEDEDVRLFIPRSSSSYFANLLIHSVYPALEILEAKNPLSLIFSDEKYLCYLTRFFIYNNGEIHRSEFAYESIKRKRAFCLSMKNHLEDDKNYFVKEQLRWLGKSEDSLSSIIFLRDVYKKEALFKFTNFLKDSANCWLNKEDQEAFREEVKKFFLEICPELMKQKSRLPGLKVINDNFKKLAIDFYITSKSGKKKGEKTLWKIITH